jgi:hypothetical protein
MQASYLAVQFHWEAVNRKTNLPKLSGLVPNRPTSLSHEFQRFAQSTARNKQVRIQHRTFGLVRVQKTRKHKPLDWDDWDVFRRKSLG